MVEKVPPHNIDAEENVCGSLILDSEAIRKIVNGLKPEDFYSQRNLWVYECCLNLYQRHEVIDQITVAQELARTDKLENCGGVAFLAHLVSVVATSLDVEYYANIVYRLSVCRKAIAVSEQIANIGYQQLPDSNETINKISELTDNFKKANTVLSNDVITPIKAANDLYLMYSKNREPMKVPSWGFIDLDKITAGIYPEYIIIAARTSMGKSQVALDVADSLVVQGEQVLFASCEMQNTQIYERKLSRLTGMSILDIRKQGISEKYEPQIMQLVGELSESKINYLTGKLFLSDIYKQIDNLLSKGKLGCVFIDYIGALQDCYADGRDNQNVKIGKISNQIQSMVHEFNIPIIALCQLNRELEHRADPHPQLSDLRDSGSLEQDADVIFLGHRDRQEDGTLSNVLELWMAKNRQISPRPPVQLLYRNDLCRYVNYTEHYEEPANYQSALN